MKQQCGCIGGGTRWAVVDNLTTSPVTVPGQCDREIKYLSRAYELRGGAVPPNRGGGLQQQADGYEPAQRKPQGQCRSVAGQSQIMDDTGQKWKPES